MPLNIDLVHDSGRLDRCGHDDERGIDRGREFSESLGRAALRDRLGKGVPCGELMKHDLWIGVLRGGDDALERVITVGQFGEA